MIKKVEFFSQRIAEGIVPNELEALISITDNEWAYGASHPKLANLKKGWKYLLRLVFDDVDNPGEANLFTAEHAKRIIEFIGKVDCDPDINTLYIHCAAGISRSAAVAKFVADITECEIFQMKYGTYQLYNKHVYSTLRRTYFEGRL